MQGSLGLGQDIGLEAYLETVIEVLCDSDSRFSALMRAARGEWRASERFFSAPTTDRGVPKDRVPLPLVSAK